MRLANLYLLLFLFGAHHCLAAEIYKWVDEDGKVHFSDSPPLDAKVEEIKVDETIIGEPDEGELRRRRLLERAEADASIRIEERRRARESRQAHEHVQDIEQQNCLDARIQLEVLKEEAPVYRDDQGKWRANWKYDTYQGERIYLSDKERPAALDKARKNIEAHCEEPDDQEAQTQARIRWVYSERCAAARVELKAAERPEAKNPQSTIENQRRIVQRYCKE